MGILVNHKLPLAQKVNRHIIWDEHRRKVSIFLWYSGRYYEKVGITN